MTYGSLFSGAGGFDLGFERAGFTGLFGAEIDPAASDVYAKLGVPNLGDVSLIDPRQLPIPDVLIWGSPCQNFSRANTRREGLEGNSSSLFYHGIRILSGLVQRRGNRPLLSVWENVPGVFTTNQGNDFRAILSAFLELGTDSLYWRKLDGRYFGVPQSRTRVIVVADFGIGSRGEVLCDASSSRLHTSAREKNGMELPTRSLHGALTARQPSRSARPDYLVDTHWCIKSQHPRMEMSPGYLFFAPAITTHPSRSVSKHSFVHSTLLSRLPRDSIMRGNTWIHTSNRLRWRTPLESERLMGWPDDWTATGASGRPMSDAARYRMTGNGVIAPFAEWIAHGCKLVLGGSAS